MTVTGIALPEEETIMTSQTSEYNRLITYIF
jgi:hypothetical protein